MKNLYLILGVIAEVLVSITIFGIWSYFTITTHNSGLETKRMVACLPVAIWFLQFVFFLHSCGWLPTSTRNSHARNSE